MIKTIFHNNKMKGDILMNFFLLYIKKEIVTTFSLKITDD